MDNIFRNLPNKSFENSNILTEILERYSEQFNQHYRKSSGLYTYVSSYSSSDLSYIQIYFTITHHNVDLYYRLFEIEHFVGKPFPLKLNTFTNPREDEYENIANAKEFEKVIQDTFLSERFKLTMQDILSLIKNVKNEMETENEEEEENESA